MKQYRTAAAPILALLLLLLTLLPGCSAEKLKNGEPVQMLTCTRSTAVSAVYPAGGTRAAVIGADYEAMRTTVQIVDAAKDAMEQERVLDGVWDLREQDFADGRYALCNRENNTWMFLAADLTELGTMAAENVDGYFSYDGGSYYFLRDHVLFRQSTDNGALSRVTVSPDLRMLDIAAFDAPSGQMAVEFFLSPYDSECGTAILDTADGRITMLQKERYRIAFTDDGVCLPCFDTELLAYSVLCGSGENYYFAEASFFPDECGDFYPISGSPYLVGVSNDISTLYTVDAQVRSSSLADYGIDREMYTACYLPDAALLLGAVYEDGAFRFYAIDPEQLTFRTVGDAASAPSPMTVDKTAAEAYWSAVNGLPVAENLQEARQYADLLEQTYGVHILLSSQCREAAELSSYDLILSDTMEETAEVEGVRSMLEAMGRAFSLYPEGFLAQFRNSAGEGGLCFLLVAYIESDYGVVGCAYSGVDWQYIAMDIASLYMADGTICHEIWHAMEDRITSKNFDAFNWDDWAALNPEGFYYYGDATMQDPTQPWTLYSSPIEEVHFVDTYSCVAASEDRARIMEFFMTHNDEAELLIRSPFIRQKLQMMCDAVRSTFDTAGWENVRWERLL